MNLPTYALSDSPQSSILNVCLGLPPPTKPLIHKLDHSQSHESSANLKGKARAKDTQEVLSFHDTDQIEEEWQDFEYQPTQPHTSKPPSKSSIKTHLNPPSVSNPKDHSQLLSRTGWDESFATANSDGWVIYRTYPLKVIHKHVVPNGSLRIVAPLHRTNILYLVGGPPSPMYSPNKVILYDSSKSKAIFSIELTQPVVGLTARLDKLVVVLRNQVHVFRVTNQTISEEGYWETSDNPNGLACLGSDFGSSLLVFLGRQAGKVQLVNLPPFQPDQPSETSAEPFQPIRVQKSRQSPYPSTSILVAHTTSLASLAITPDGKLIATASVTGTLIRIWDSKTSALLHELRRGTDGAAMWGLRFRPDGLAICASSDKGTIHVWSLTDRVKPKAPNQERKPGRPLALLKPYLPKYFHSTWSDAFFRLPPPGPSCMKSLPLSLFSSLPSSSTLTRAGDSSGGTMQYSSGPSQTSEVSKPPTIEDDVSSVNWVLATTRKGDDTIGVDQSFIEPQIIAITRSGGWFRLRIPHYTSLPDHHHHHDDDHSSNTSSHGTPNRLGISNDPSVQLECVEYRRLGQVEDWSDSEDSN